MITDCGSPIETCGTFESLVDKLWDIGRDTGQHFLHQINAQLPQKEIQGVPVWYILLLV